MKKLMRLWLSQLQMLLRRNRLDQGFARTNLIACCGETSRVAALEWLVDRGAHYCLA